MSKPRFTAILPPGNAHAFGTELFSTTNSYGRSRSLTAASFCPTPRDVGGELGVERVVAALHLLRRRVLLLADRDFLVGRDERELAIAGDGVDHAACDRREQRRDDPNSAVSYS